MLDNLITSKEKSKTILITDTVKQRGLNLLKCCIQSSLLRAVHVLVVLLENQPTILDNLANQTNLEVFNPGSDPLGWLGKSTRVSCNDLCRDLLSCLQPYKDQKVTVIFDSLSLVMIQNSAAYACQLLHRIGNIGKDTTIIGLLHRDLHEKNVVELLEHQASSILHLSPAINSPHYALAHTLHKKTTGKVVRSREYFSLTERHEISDTQDASNIVDTSSMMEGILAPDPTANLTFNLSLTEREKDDRSRVPLPYMHHKQAGGTASGGKIFYQPDDADDFDEEDPDDDLDI